MRAPPTSDKAKSLKMISHGGGGTGQSWLKSALSGLDAIPLTAAW
jgi:hypothetical protein